MQKEIKFTQCEKDFVVEFLADTLHALTINNVLSRQEGDGFIRMCDAREVLDNLEHLYDLHEDEEDFVKGETNASWTFTVSDAEDALTSYDTEYRECITEQFEEACTDACTDEEKKLLDADFTTLAERLLGY
jgi:hypothetical protein